MTPPKSSSFPTQGPSWGYSKVNFQETSSIFGDKCPRDGSKNDPMAPRTTLECPHEGPPVVSGPLSAHRSRNQAPALGRGRERGKRETRSYEPFARHVPIHLATLGKDARVGCKCATCWPTLNHPTPEPRRQPSSPEPEPPPATVQIKGAKDLKKAI